MKATIALGSNLGHSEAILQSAISSLAEIMELTAVSTFHSTAPVGGPAQPDYLNAVLIGECEWEPLVLLAKLQAIEAQAGRVRDVRWGPRTLDLDLITYGELLLDHPQLIVPHPRAHERGFVLLPWLEIDPHAQIPGRGRVADLLADLEV